MFESNLRIVKNIRTHYVYEERGRGKKKHIGWCKKVKINLNDKTDNLHKSC